MQLDLRFQPYVSLAYPGSTFPDCVYNNGRVGFCGQPHVTLPIAIHDSCEYCGSEEADDIKE